MRRWRDLVAFMAFFAWALSPGWLERHTRRWMERERLLLLRDEIERTGWKPDEEGRDEDRL